MSTFNGVVCEFLRIRIDFFRTNPSQPPPLACFLSHVHSDHLQGLESLRAPFVYCSPATRRLLLRMEKYPHRMNFAKGILERRKQTYRHLQMILKAIPLQTPTEIELGAAEKIRVTLFDANHCPGAVMFLIEGDCKAILYTGDVRAEAWWVNSIIRNPVLIPYTLGGKRLDCLYLDTTFATADDIYRDFPSKAIGIQELLQKVQRYSPETTFYFRAWTLGYEDVWVALSAALSSKIHVDEYQFRLYRSLSEDSRDGLSVAEAPALNGFQAGNHIQPGCLTTESRCVRLHSCEPGTACHEKLAKDKNVVWITPIVTRSRDGAEVYEIGAGGRSGGLYHTAELDIADPESVEALADLCVRWVDNPAELSLALQRIAFAQISRIPKMSLGDLGLDSDEGISLKQLVSRLASFEGQKGGGENVPKIPGIKAPDGEASSDAIHFPYSRHASYNELRLLVSAFKPRDICPCTVDEDTWSAEVSMQALFGDLCTESHFDHDQQLRARLEGRKRKREDQQESQESQESENGHDADETADRLVDMRAVEVRLLRQAIKGCTGEGTCLVTKGTGNVLTAEMNPKSAVNEDGHIDVSVPAGSNSSEVTHKGSLPRVDTVQNPNRTLGNTRRPSSDDLTQNEETCSPPNTRLQAIKKAFERMNPGVDTISRGPVYISDEAHVVHGQDGLPGEDPRYQTKRCCVQDAIAAETTGEAESQLTLTTSAFESQRSLEDTQDSRPLGFQLDGALDRTEPLRHRGDSGNPFDIVPHNRVDSENKALTTPIPAEQKSRRLYAIKEAYRAARRCLLDGADAGSWEDLDLRSVGRKGHIEEEMEL